MIFTLLIFLGETTEKKRPVLVLEQQGAVVFVFNITTQYANKSEIIRRKYYKIVDWQQAGLDKQSYIDTNVIRDLPMAALDGRAAIGKLTDADVKRLVDFIINR